MRKQIDFAYRQLEYSSVDSEKSTFVWSAWVRDNYLSRGWEILTTEVVRAEANSVFLGISFVKYEDEAPRPALRSPNDSQVAESPRRGRPPKIVERVEDAVS